MCVPDSFFFVFCKVGKDTENEYWKKKEYHGRKPAMHCSFLFAHIESLHAIRKTETVAMSLFWRKIFNINWALLNTLTNSVPYFFSYTPLISLYILLYAKIFPLLFFLFIIFFSWLFTTTYKVSIFFIFSCMYSVYLNVLFFTTLAL